jgi:hypothetical protein
MTLRPKIDKRVRDPNEFDRALVRSTLAFYNATHSDEPKELPIVVSRLAEQTFGWVPAVMAERARRERLDPSKQRWNSRESIERVTRVQSVLLYMIGAFRVEAHEAVTLADGRRLSREQWYQEVVEKIDFDCGLRVIDGATRHVALPLLSGIEECVGYAISVIRRRNLAKLVRPCQFLLKDLPGSLAHHYFLADDPRQKFCSPAHSNAYRQREWRRDRARKHK